MYRPLFWLSLGAITTLVLAFATFHELTRYRPELELRRAVAAFAASDAVTLKSAVDWIDGTGRERTVETVYTSGQARPGGEHQGEYGLKFRAVKLVPSAASYTDLSGEVRALDGRFALTYDPPGPAVPGSPFGTPGTWLSLSADERTRWGEVVTGMDWPLAVPFSPAPWSREGLGRLTGLLRAADVAYASGKDQDRAVVNGVSCRAVDVRFDKAATETFFVDAVKAKEDRDATPAEQVRAGRLAEALSRFAFRVWIGVDDHRPYRVEAGGIAVDAAGADVPVNALVDLSAYGAFAVAPPPRMLAFSVAFPSLAALPTVAVRDGVALPVIPAPTFALATQDDTDGDGLSNLLEAFYGTDQNNPDTDADGLTDGEEIGRGCNPRGHGSLFGFGLGRPLVSCP